MTDLAFFDMRQKWNVYSIQNKGRFWILDQVRQLFRNFILRQIVQTGQKVVMAKI